MKRSGNGLQWLKLYRDIDSKKGQIPQTESYVVCKSIVTSGTRSVPDNLHCRTG